MSENNSADAAASPLLSDVLLALADRCESNGPDRELDAEIWLAAVPGSTRRKTGYTHKASGRWCEIDETRLADGRLITVPSYTTSLDAAVTLVPDHWSWLVRRLHNAKDSAKVWPGWLGDGFDGNARTPTLALCGAALNARAAIAIAKAR